MDVSGEQPEGGWIGVAGRSPVHCETFGATVGCDREYRGVCAIFVVGVAGDIKGLEERSDIPYMHLAGFGPGGDVVRLGHGRKRGRCRERLGPNTVNAAKVRNGSELEEGIFVQGIRIIFVIGIRDIWKIRKETELVSNRNVDGSGILIGGGGSGGETIPPSFFVLCKADIL